MKLFKRLSTNTIIIIGLIIAIIPIILAVLQSGQNLKYTSQLGRDLNAKVFQQTKVMRQVLQKASDIERKARLFVLLSDPAFKNSYERQSYETVRASFNQALSELLLLKVDNKVALLANELAEKENLIYQQIINTEHSKTADLPVDLAFQGLRESAATLSKEFESYIDNQFDLLRLHSDKFEQQILMNAGLLLALSLFIIVVLIVSYSRSVRWLTNGLKLLSGGNFKQMIAFDQRQDLFGFAYQLESLRTQILDLEAAKYQRDYQQVAEVLETLESLDLSEPETENADAISAEAKLEDCKNRLFELLNSDIFAKQKGAVDNTINMNALLDEVLSGFESYIDTKALTIQKLVKPVFIQGEYTRLRGIVESLLYNAIKYSANQGEIRILLRASQQEMEFEIEDDRMTHSFEPQNPDKIDPQDQQIGEDIAIYYHGQIELFRPEPPMSGFRVCIKIPLPEQAR